MENAKICPRCKRRHLRPVFSLSMAALEMSSENGGPMQTVASSVHQERKLRCPGCGNEVTEKAEA